MTKHIHVHLHRKARDAVSEENLRQLMREFDSANKEFEAAQEEASRAWKRTKNDKDPEYIRASVKRLEAQRRYDTASNRARAAGLIWDAGGDKYRVK